MDTEIDILAYRLALAQLPKYRQIYSSDFTILDSYRIAVTLIEKDREQQKNIGVLRAQQPKKKQIHPPLLKA